MDTFEEGVFSVVLQVNLIEMQDNIQRQLLEKAIFVLQGWSFAATSVWWEVMETIVL